MYACNFTCKRSNPYVCVCVYACVCVPKEELIIKIVQQSIYIHMYYVLNCCSEPTGRTAAQLQSTCYTLHTTEETVVGVYKKAGTLCSALSSADQTPCYSSAPSLSGYRLGGTRRERKF